MKLPWGQLSLLITSCCLCGSLSAEELPTAYFAAENLPTVCVAAQPLLLASTGSTPTIPASQKSSASVPPQDLIPSRATNAQDEASTRAGRLDDQELSHGFLNQVGYDGGFVISSRESQHLEGSDDAYRLVINGWGQLRDTVFDAKGAGSDLNQLQLKRARMIFSGHAFNPDFRYYVQLDGRSNAGDSVRILDYFLTYDFGHRHWNLARDTLGFKTGLYKMPFSLARQLSGKELEFADRSMSSMYFDVNRSLAWGLYGRINASDTPLMWETALFNGLVTGGAETGSSGALDNNNAFSARVYCFPVGEWQSGQLADLTNHDSLATRLGAGWAFTSINRFGSTEFDALRTVDTGVSLAQLLPGSVDEYDVELYSIDGSMKLLGVSATCEYYFRNISGFRGENLGALFDHGFWLQAGIFVIPEKFELLARWSRVQGTSGTLGAASQSSEEIASGCVCYFREQHAKLTVDATYLNGASINSSALDINAGDIGWLYRTQIQFSF